MVGSGSKRGVACAIASLFLISAGASAQVQNLRITEVSPWTNQVEVVNTGPAFTTPAAYPFCHRLNYTSVIPSGTEFAAASAFGPGEWKVFTVSNLNNLDSDLWLYDSTFFTNANAIVHGLKYGPQANVGRTGLAASVGLWPGASAFAPAPPQGMTLVYEGYGSGPADWYVNETPSLGGPHGTKVGAYPSSLSYPGGVDDFEDVPLGQLFVAVEGWSAASTSEVGRFTVRVVNDVLGEIGPRPGSSSTRWLRIRDRDAGDVQNRFYSPAVVAPAVENYTWTLWVNLETTPPGASAAKPRMMIQHMGSGGFADAWGIEFAEAGASLVVTEIGGQPSSAALYPLSGATGIGQWVRIDLSVDFDAMEMSATAGGGPRVSLPIDPNFGFGLRTMRFCYRGEGVGNEMVMLLDDVSVAFGSLVDPCPWDVTGSGAVGAADLGFLLGCWGGSVSGECETADFSGDMAVGAADLAAMLGNWGPCPS